MLRCTSVITARGQQPGVMFEALENRRLMSATSLSVTIHSVLTSAPPAATGVHVTKAHPPAHTVHHHPAPKPRKPKPVHQGKVGASKPPVVSTPVASTPVTNTPGTSAGQTSTSPPVTSTGGTTTSQPPVNTGVTPPIPGNWQTTFDDEFNGTTLNPVWHPAQYWDHTVTVVGKGELEAYDASAVSVSDGQLHLTARADTQDGTPYVSGLVQSGGDLTNPAQPTFSFQYGYMEVRARIPKGQGFWPAIWMMPASHNDSNGEIDVMEALGGDPTTAYFTLHHLGINKVDQRIAKGTDLSNGFHTFGIDWEPDHITWYLDGVAVGTVTDPTLIPHEPMYPIMNLAVGGNWGGPPDASTQFPSSMDVDYIHVWQMA